MHYSCHNVLNVGWDSSVSTVNHYGLDSPGTENHGGQDLLHPSKLALGPTQPPIRGVPGLSWGLSGGVWC